MHPRLLAPLLLVFALVGAGCGSPTIVTRARECERVLRDFSLSTTPIPEEALASAKAIAVLSETEGGVVVGGSGATGLMVERTDRGWSAPIALDSWGATFGAQIGGQGRDIVLVFRDAEEIRRVIESSGYAMAEASGAFGSSTGAANDNDCPAEAYVRGSGLFGGARVGGVRFEIDEKANDETYGMRYSTEDILSGRVDWPPGTSDFRKMLPAPR